MEEQIKTPAKRGPKPKVVEPVIEEAVVADVEQHEEPVEHVVPHVEEVKVHEKPVGVSIDRNHVWYTVRQGDSLEYIASRFSRTEAEIAKVNNIPLQGRLISGTALKIYLD